MKKLSIKQLRTLGAMAHAAHSAVGAGIPFDEWRRDVTSTATGKGSWKTLTQEEYIPLLNALRRLQGLPPVPDRTPKDKHASLLWTLKDKMQQWAIIPAYVAAIAADKFARPWLHEECCVDVICTGLSIEQMKQLIYTVQRAGRRAAQRTVSEYDLSPVSEVHACLTTMPRARLTEYRGDIRAAPPPPPRRQSAQLARYSLSPPPHTPARMHTHPGDFFRPSSCFSPNYLAKRLHHPSFPSNTTASS